MRTAFSPLTSDLRLLTSQPQPACLTQAPEDRTISLNQRKEFACELLV